MRISVALLLVLGGWLAMSRQDAAPAAAPAGTKLVWSDEFDHDGAPDPAKWGYEVGYVRNHEAQYYTQDRRENVRVENGVLVIEGRKEHYAIPGREGEFAEYTSGSINTLGQASWRYGRIEVRAKLPHGKGTWPAIWMLGDNIKQVGWPRCGEIDIMEFVGHTPDKVHSTVHFRKDGKHQSSGHNLTVSEPWNDFHVYAVDWTPERIELWFDDQKVHSFDLPAAETEDGNPFQKPQYLLLNLALGGSWGREIDDSILPQQFQVDYVRVYQPADEG